jgi:hypothetical protein
MPACGDPVFFDTAVHRFDVDVSSSVVRTGSDTHGAGVDRRLIAHGTEMT